MSPLEAMARAAWRENIGCEPEGFLPQWNDLTAKSKREMMDSMRAALTALRDCEITDAMWNAYCGAIDANVTKDQPRRVFRDMLNAILEEG